ncbi:MULTISPECIES: restriction endonuclease subunit S [Helicobacter]|uniref:restriction endonuclease subunit S n=1 Tax=Helicobacter TaxID=209 RepID=UPI00261F43A4|nr:restriction endonuclease subunit S [Helicobacter sp. UBA3407]
MINNIPKNWQVKTLGEIVLTTSGGTPSRKNMEYWNGNIKWLKSGELNDDYIKDSEESITQKGLDNSSAKIFLKGTLLIALYGATIGKLGILDIDLSTNQAICGIIPLQENCLETKYLFYYLFSLRKKMLQDAFGGAQLNISQSYLRGLPIPLPPLETQKAIVEKLENAFAHIDEAVHHLKAVQTNIPRLKSSLLHSAFSGKLTESQITAPTSTFSFSQRKSNPSPLPLTKEMFPFFCTKGEPAHSPLLAKNRAGGTTAPAFSDFSHHEVGAENAESLRDISASPQYDKEDNLPQGWEVKTLAEVCTSKNSNIVLSSIENNTGKYPIYGAKGLLKTIDFYTIENESLGIVKDGAGVGRIFLLPEKSSLIGTMAYIQANENLNLKYLYHFLHTINFNQYISGSAIPHIYFRDYKKEKIPLPPLETQKQIVQILESKFAHLEKLAQFVNESLENLQRLKSSLLNQAFKGELV